jgi:hypothetical protein
MKSILALVYVLALLEFSCQSKKNTTNQPIDLSSATDTVELSVKEIKTPMLTFNLMERRNASTSITLEDIKPNQQIHWIKFNKQAYEPDGHRYILYRFYISASIPPGSTYEFEMLSMKGNNILFTSNQKGNYFSDVRFMFEEPMYEIEKQRILLKIFSPHTKEPFVEFNFSVILDNTNIVGFDS